MPDSWQDYVYLLQLAVIGIGLGAIGTVSWWGFGKLIAKISDMDKTMGGFVQEMQAEREARKDQYHALERRIVRIETRCDGNHHRGD